MIISIDQNSHSLWDTLPKLQALQAAGRPVCHYLEDIDVAFTALGANVDEPNLHIAQERYHPSGGVDWGAAAFYNDFLGRLPVDIRQWESLLGMKIPALAKQWDVSLEELYHRFATGDNWMLIGSSYVGDTEHHRIIGDLSVQQTAPFVRWLLSRAEIDCLERFPTADSQQRTRAWFAAETQRVDQLIASCPTGTLLDLYRLWMNEHLHPPLPMPLTSERFALGASPDNDVLLELFLKDYSLAAELYNQAVRETNLGLHELNVKRGEAPFFAFGSWQGHRTRSEVRIQNGTLLIAGHEFAAPEGCVPYDRLREAGILGLAGKAIVLALQVRLPPHGLPLVLPHGGSTYMPACHRFYALLKEHKFLASEAAAVVRVRFRLMDRMKSLDTPIRLPTHLAGAIGRDVVPARWLGENWADLVIDAKQQLAEFADSVKRASWQNTALPNETQQLQKLDAEKRTLAAANPKDPRTRELWKQIRELQNQVLEKTLLHISYNYQLSQLEFYDSRGALLPWCLALGGEAFYHDVITHTEIHNDV